ncbi:AEC family transporter [Alkalicoccobacillus porphyridii]|uniref:AEC family transporter n=1 Tax=Alkalicoccobacillus porphyridii TaxID=2597270 RepID=A0A554A0V3_9BACI|nr:AEC family transporter [Alkalicoccobacillus porphyridii]TSB47318.1 AEC family transporter [Alkalicoccobacillus porphyridii]
MLELYLMFFVGLVAYWIGWIPSVGRPVLTNLLLYVTLPCLIVTSMDVPFDSSLGKGVGLLILLSIYFLAGTACIAKWSSVMLNLNPFTSGVYQSLLLFGNQGFIGVAVVSHLVGPEFLFIAVVFNLVYFILIWTYGIWLMCQGKEGMKLSTIWGNPGFVATLVGLCLFFLPISMPATLNNALSSVGEMTVPLSMIVIGCFTASISKNDLKQYLGSGLVWLITLLRLLVLPAALFLPVLFLHLPLDWLLVAVLLSATPCAPTISLFAEKYGGDVKLATVSVLVSTLFASVTLPFLFWLFEWLGTGLF